MDKTLDRALSKALGAVPAPKEAPSPVEVAAPADKDDMGRTALQQYRKAKDFLRKGNWVGFGKALEKLEKILLKMSRVAEEAK